MLPCLLTFKSDNLPRRSCCRFISFKIKNLNIFIREYAKKNPKKKVFDIFLVFDFKSNLRVKNFNYLCAFFPKIKENNILILSRNVILLKKQNAITLTFYQKFNGLVFQNIFNNCKFLFLEKKYEFLNSFFILNLFKKKKISIHYFKFKKKITQSLVNSLVNFTKELVLKIKISKHYCYKKLRNNILQITGDFFDFIPKSYNSVKKIGIKKKMFCFYL